MNFCQETDDFLKKLNADRIIIFIEILMSAMESINIMNELLGDRCDGLF